MIASVFERVAPYGREMTVTDRRGNTVRCRGFLQPEDTMAEDFPAYFKSPGAGPETRYLLLLAPEAGEAAAVACGGKHYEVLGIHPVYCADVLTHWEGVARERSGSDGTDS